MGGLTVFPAGLSGLAQMHFTQLEAHKSLLAHGNHSLERLWRKPSAFAIIYIQACLQASSLGQQSTCAVL